MISTLFKNVTNENSKNIQAFQKRLYKTEKIRKTRYAKIAPSDGEAHRR